MSKRDVLSVFMLVVGGLMVLSADGLLVGLPLFGGGAYWLAEAYAPRTRVSRTFSGIARQVR